VLNAKELGELKRLQEKQTEFSEPMTEADLLAIEARVTQAVNSYDVAMHELFVKPWTAHCKMVHELANDNARLAAEVRKLLFPKGSA
jgi:hypothetical protein